MSDLLHLLVIVINGDLHREDLTYVDLACAMLLFVRLFPQWDDFFEPNRRLDCCNLIDCVDFDIDQ